MLRLYCLKSVEIWGEIERIFWMHGALILGLEETHKTDKSYAISDSLKTK